jgi:glycosyltransferase involved in cell wall biosynthesis
VRPRRSGRDLLVPAGADPAHDLNLLWAHLRAQPGGWTHVVAFGGDLPVLAGPVLAAWLGVPLVTLLRGNDFDAAVFNPRRRPALDAAVSASAAVACVTRDMAARAAALWPGTPVEAIANGIDRTLFAATAGDRERAARWRVPGRLHLGLIGHLKAKKGALLLLDALRRSGRADAVQLLLAGEPAPELETWLAEHVGEVHATLISESDRLALIPVYLACDWVAIPSFYDGMPNVLLEALALGVPVIAADAGGMPELVRDGENGLLFAAGDLEGCRAALERAFACDLSGAATALPAPAAEAAAYRALLTRTAGPGPTRRTRTPARPPARGPAVPAS